MLLSCLNKETSTLKVVRFSGEEEEEGGGGGGAVPRQGKMLFWIRPSAIEERERASERAFWCCTELARSFLSLHIVIL